MSYQDEIEEAKEYTERIRKMRRNMVGLDFSTKASMALIGALLIAGSLPVKGEEKDPCKVRNMFLLTGTAIFLEILGGKELFALNLKKEYIKGQMRQYARKFDSFIHGKPEEAENTDENKKLNSLKMSGKRMHYFDLYYNDKLEKSEKLLKIAGQAFFAALSFGIAAYYAKNGISDENDTNAVKARDWIVATQGLSLLCIGAVEMVVGKLHEMKIDEGDKLHQWCYEQSLMDNHFKQISGDKNVYEQQKTQTSVEQIKKETGVTANSHKKVQKRNAYNKHTQKSYRRFNYK